jgi:hypothetical protein
MDGELLAQVYKTTQTSFTPSSPTEMAPAPSPMGAMSSVSDGYPPFPDTDDEDEDLDDEDLDDDEDDDDEDDDDEDDEFGPAERN